MDNDCTFEAADSVVYTKWVHRKSWNLQEASWLLAGYERGKSLTNEFLALGNFEALEQVNRYESALLEGVKQENCAKRLSPLEWIKFARKRGIAVPSDLAKFFPGERSIFQRCDDLEREVSICRAATASLRKAEQDAVAKDKPLSIKERDNLLRIIGALLQVIEGDGSVAKHPAFKSQTKLIEHLTEHYIKVSGLSERQLQKIFPEAKQSLL